jgi:4-amino-4-deoxy-L-arabinose transferase-like glycosyltransferase
MLLARGNAFDRATLAFLAVLIAMTWARVAVLQLNPIGLYYDEAQYWMWSRSLEWGYFSKPPLIAWAIAGTTALFGDSEWAVRLAAPLAHAVGALALYGLARAMYGAWAGFWAGLGWLMLPGIWLSSSIISTDALMLPFWSIALLAMWRLTLTRAWFWAIMLGAAVGLGAQAKYAMLYFIPCAAYAAWRMPVVRQALAKGRAIVAGLVALAVIAPNIAWNARHGFVTAQHTAANARLDISDLFNFDELFEFLINQAGVLGPLVFMALGWLFWRALREGRSLRQEDQFLLAFIAPPLIFVSLIAFVSRANANWVAVAYPAMLVWVTGSLLVSPTGRRFFAAATTINVAIGAALVFATFDPALSNQAKGVRMARDWDVTAREIALRAAAQPGEPPFTAVMVDHRATYFELNYYWREARRAGEPLPPVRMWLLHGDPRNTAELNDPMRSEEGGRVLVVHLSPQWVSYVAADFTAFRKVEDLVIPLGGGVNRALEISVGEAFAPAPRDAAFEARLREEGRD